MNPGGTVASKRCGCASESCACVISGGVGIDVSGTGSKTNPYVLEASVAPSSLDVQNENTVVRAGVTLIDFQGGGVDAVAGGAGEVIVTVPAPPVVRAMAAGVATIAAPSALNTPTSVTVTFPAGRFSAAPIVTATIAGSTSPQGRSAVNTSAVSATSVTFWVTQLSGTLATTTIHWQAVEAG